MSNTNKKINWESSILELSKTKRIPKNLQLLFDSGIRSIRDLIWIIPLKVQKAPKLSSFSQIVVNELFLGHAKVINTKISPSSNNKSRSKVQLFNVQLVVKDLISDNYLTLKWFNAYPNIIKELKEKDEFTFLATISDYKGSFQAINPKLDPKALPEGSIITYPTINSVSSKFIKNFIERIPNSIWNLDLYPKFKDVLESLKINDISMQLRVIHGKEEYDSKAYEVAKERLIYLEFFIEQINVIARKRKNQTLESIKISTSPQELNSFIDKFPYELTEDQKKAILDIKNDLTSGHPMMRIIQGDVGCGKTTIAIVSTYMALKNGHQVAVMCPTESLANQLFIDFQKYIKEESSLLTSSAKNQTSIRANLENGTTKLVIGTHSLFQDSVRFKDLKLIVIDEQHKFGVEQRQKLKLKGENPHTLIMSATPIPRTLQLSKYGDLDISTIKTMPENKKSIKTRIVENINFEKFLSFVKTRIGLKEQVYIVTAAIDESQNDINDLERIFSLFQHYFPTESIGKVHGRLSSEEKESALKSFKDKDIQILIATSVIEVGINNANATVMGIFNPERFGLSSLHQLRGRVARGSKNGFCFLLTDKSISFEALTRLKVMEDTNDGFQIAQADLLHRGQGNLFGKEQSGKSSARKIANIIEHIQIFENVSRDLNHLMAKEPELIDKLIPELLKENNISSTI